MKQAVRAAEARSRSVMLEVAEVMGLSTKCQGGFVVAAVLCGLAMRLPRASRAKPARLVLIPAADAFVPRGTLTPVVGAEGSRRRARLIQHLLLYPLFLLSMWRSLRTGWRPLWRTVPIQLLCALGFAVLASPALVLGTRLLGHWEDEHPGSSGHSWTAFLGGPELPTL